MKMLRFLGFLSLAMRSAAQVTVFSSTTITATPLSALTPPAIPTFSTLASSGQSMLSTSLSITSTMTTDIPPSFHTTTNVVSTSVTQYTTAKIAQAPSVADCWANPGGVVKINDTNYLNPGCGAILTQIMSCFDEEAMNRDIYDNETNIHFQACFCGTDSTHPYTEESVLAINFTGCAQCLLMAGAANFDDMAHQNQRLTGFCRAEVPFAWLFLRNWKLWLDAINKEVNITSMPITGYEAGGGQYTTLPPLANMAWGPSAPDGGALAGVTPELTTITTANSADGGTQVITSFVSWVPTQSGSTFDSSGASSSEGSAASSAFSTAICQGRNACSLSKGTVTRPTWLLLLVAFVLLG